MTEAILLVGGRGTRLRPLTLDTPKPLLPVAGLPFLAHVLARLGAAGVDHAVLATAYRADDFRDLVSDGAAYGVRVTCVPEDTPLGTGGAIRNAAAALSSGPSDPVVVLNSDVLSDHDIAGQVRRHVGAAADVTLALTTVEDARPFGCVPTDSAGWVKDFLEKSPEPVTNDINAGCYVFARRVIDTIPAGTVVSVERETFPELLAAGGRVLGVSDGGYWIDVGTPEALVRASRDLVSGRAASPLVPSGGRTAIVLPGAEVDPAARLSGGSTLGTGAVVGAGAVVTGSMLYDGAQVRDGAVVTDSVVAAGAVVGERTVLTGVTVGARASIGADNELRSGARVWPDTVLADRAVRFSSDE